MSILVNLKKYAKHFKKLTNSLRFKDKNMDLNKKGNVSHLKIKVRYKRYYTNSMIAIGAASPTLVRVLMILV